MKLTIVLPLLFSTLGLAAPTAVEKRQSTAQVTLYKNVQYGNPNTLLTVALDTDSSDGCTNLPPSFNNQVLSIKLHPSGSWLFCRLYDGANCDSQTEQTWAFQFDVPDLNGTDYKIGDRASSIYCASNAGGPTGKE